MADREAGTSLGKRLPRPDERLYYPTGANMNVTAENDGTPGSNGLGQAVERHTACRRDHATCLRGTSRGDPQPTRLARANVIVLCAAMAFTIAAWQQSALGDTITWGTYLSQDLHDIRAILDGKTGLEKHPNALFSQPWGHITFQNGDQILPGAQIWVVANNDRQVVGELDIIMPGAYNFLGQGGSGYGIYGDDGELPDKGAVIGESLLIFAQVNGAYFEGSFISGPLANGYELITNKRCDINAMRLLGDTNMDGKVTFSDYQMLEAGFGCTGCWEQGDFNSNGFVEFGDYQILEANYGESSVPEPTALALLGSCAVLLLRRRCSCVSTNQ